MEQKLRKKVKSIYEKEETKTEKNFDIFEKLVDRIFVERKELIERLKDA